MDDWFVCIDEADWPAWLLSPASLPKTWRTWFVEKLEEDQYCDRSRLHFALERLTCLPGCLTGS